MTPEARALMVWGAIITSILSSSAFVLALVVAYLSQDHTNVSLLVGAVIANFSTVVSFWLGSSSGSQRKDDALIPPKTP